eukprot:252366_1
MMQLVGRTIIKKQLVSKASIPALNSIRNITNSNTNEYDTVIIGGGVIGCGVAYKLSQFNPNPKTNSICVLEKENNVAEVTSSLAAGMIGQIRDTVDSVKFAMESVATFQHFETERINSNFEIPSGSLKSVGSIRLAHTEQRVEEFKEILDIAQKAELNVKVLNKQEALDLWPDLNLKDVQMMLYCPNDGFVQPNDLCMTYKHRSMLNGVSYMFNSNITEIIQENNKIYGVKLANNEIIHCNNIINCSGYNSHKIAEMVGLTFPLFPVKHSYFITESIPISIPLNNNFPMIRAPDLSVYIRAENCQILCGGFEYPPLSFDPFDNVWENMNDIDWDTMNFFMESCNNVLPYANKLGIKNVVQGYPCFTNDGKFIIGKTIVDGFIMATGCNAHGVSESVGVGEYLCQSLDDKNTKNLEYLKEISPNRYNYLNDLKKSNTDQFNKTWKSLQEDAKEVYVNYYKCKKAV